VRAAPERIGALIALGVLAACAREPALPPVDASAHRAAVDAWHEEQRAEIGEKGSPLAYTGLSWLHPGANSIGADSTNEIALAGTGVPARVGALVREGDSVRLELAKGVTASINGAPTVGEPLRSDADSGKSSRVQVGSAGFRLIKRLEQIGVRRWDDDRPAFRGFHGAHYYPDDVRYRIAGDFVPYDKPTTMRVQTEAGVEQDLRVVGKVRARIGGERYELTTFAGDSAQDLWIVFKDATNGHESYGFRYLKAARDTSTNVVALDFNYAYNPDCAYTPYATCPLPPPGNRISARIPAGEQVYETASAGIK
jgi:uncharacterized protein (DUF1684 family)